MWIQLAFDQLELPAELNASPIARQLAELLPLSLELQTWGAEVYGSIGRDLGSHRLQAQVEAGSLAYTNRGNYFCIFFGQQPAWPVDLIGAIPTGDWQKLRSARLSRLTIRKA